MGRNVQIHPSGRRGGISNSGTVIGLLVINKAGVGKFRQGTPVPSTDLLKRKFLPPLLFLFFSFSSNASDHPSAAVR